MERVGTFNSDLQNSDVIEKFLYEKLFKILNPAAKYIGDDIEKQLTGSDVVLVHPNNDEVPVDIKCASDYAGQYLPTFILELGAAPRGEFIKGWGINKKLKTQVYGLSWLHEATTSKVKNASEIVAVEVMLADVNKMRRYIFEQANAEQIDLWQAAQEMYYNREERRQYGKLKLHQSFKKAERPINLIFSKSVWSQHLVNSTNCHFIVTQKGFHVIPANQWVDKDFVNEILKKEALL